jgi:predicted DCC family thiol-disulfide oxidoreductase YuxK
MKKSVVLVDGSCALCGGLARFAAARDSGDRLRIAALRSDAGRLLLESQGLAAAGDDSFILLSEGRVFTKGTAAVRMLRMLKGGRVPALLLRALPSLVLDAGYDALASRRHWLTLGGSCSLPAADLRGRLLESADDARRHLTETKEEG